MTAPELSRPVRLDTIGSAPSIVTIAADEAERVALAARFGLIAIARLEARAALVRDGETVTAKGRLDGAATQACIATGDPVAAIVGEPFSLRFVPETAPEAIAEIELDAGDLDVIGYAGGAIDIGEAVAQGFALALDPFPRSSQADARLAAAGVLSEEEAEASRQEASPFAALKGLGKG